eukprot:TRINITY_DN1364_c0_g1_i1.p2 TRINITY_DN1364_c0_g1~~TRINITY_DN1364_c0_g1_i1.p2  ORF type:complete len:221 (-),score=89.51 TRINITY_DN1364_c0_g1_i1:98-691(-)
MPVFSIILFRWRETGPVQLVSAFELGSFNFFQRGSAKEVCLFVSREVVTRSKKGDRHTVEHKEHFCHVFVKQTGLAGAVVSDGAYPQRVAFSLLLKAMEGFENALGDSWQEVNEDQSKTMPQLDALLQKYQDPGEADDIMRIQKDLDETKEILVKSIDQLLERGERIDSLMDKSEDLSFQSKTFLRETERMNCCAIL